MKKIFYATIALTILLGCGGKTETVGMEEAAEVHNKAVALAQQLERRLDSLESVDAVSADSLVQWRNAIDQWEEELVEVPGHENHSHEGHDHHRSAVPDVTPDQMLEIQQLLLKRVQEIDTRIGSERNIKK